LHYVPICNKTTGNNLEVVKAVAAKAPSLYSLVKLEDGTEAIVAFIGCE
jgi:hypothetical protein